MSKQTQTLNQGTKTKVTRRRYCRSSVAHKFELQQALRRREEAERACPRTARLYREVSSALWEGQHSASAHQQLEFLVIGLGMALDRRQEMTLDQETELRSQILAFGSPQKLAA